MSDSSTDVFVLSRINKALRSDFQHLADADAELQGMLKDIRSFGERVQPNRSATPDWTTSWTKIDGLLEDIRTDALAMKAEMEADSPADLADFQDVTRRDEELHRCLYDVAGQFDRAAAGDQDRAEWRDLWESLQAQLDVIGAYLAGARARIEMRRKHGAAEADRLHHEILSQLPEDASLEKAGQFSEEYESALQQFQRDKHRTGGLVDVFKALLLIQEEGPGAKVTRHHRKADA